MIPFDENEYVKVSENDRLEVGDIIRMRFKINPGWLYVRAAGISAIESKLAKRKEFEILSANYVDDPDHVWYKIRIINPENDPEVQTAGIGVAAVIAIIAGCVTAIYFTYSFIECYKLKIKADLVEAVKEEKITVEDALEIMEKQVEVTKAEDKSIGSQVQKAGSGVAIAIAAVVGLLWFLNRRR